MTALPESSPAIHAQPAEGTILRRSGLSLLAVILLSVSPVLAQKTLTATEAKDHIGEQATVCGKVVSTRYAKAVAAVRLF